MRDFDISIYISLELFGVGGWGVDRGEGFRGRECFGVERGGKYKWGSVLFCGGGYRYFLGLFWFWGDVV